MYIMTEKKELLIRNFIISVMKQAGKSLETPEEGLCYYYLEEHLYLMTDDIINMLSNQFPNEKKKDIL